MPKSPKTVLDTNYLIRLVVRDVPKQTDAVVSLLNKAAANTLVISDVVFSEAVYVLEKVYEYKRDIIAKAMSYVLEHPAFDVRVERLTHALGKYTRHKSLSFVDCYVWAQAELATATITTFDKDLQRKYEL